MLNMLLFQVKYWMGRFGVTEEEGQGLVEYALIIVLIAIVVIAALSLLGPQIANVFNSIRTSITEAGVN